MVTETHRHHTSSSLTAHGLVMTTTPAPKSTLSDGIKSLPEAAGFLVLFRLWRVVRIANGKLVLMKPSLLLTNRNLMSFYASRKANSS